MLISMGTLRLTGAKILNSASPQFVCGALLKRFTKTFGLFGYALPYRSRTKNMFPGFFTGLPVPTHSLI